MVIMMIIMIIMILIINYHFFQVGLPCKTIVEEECSEKEVPRWEITMIMTAKNTTSHIYALLVAKFAGMPGLCGGSGGGAILAMLGFWEHLVSQTLPKI